MTNLDFVDVSGAGNSGKSAIVDLLREIEGMYVCPNQFEFDLIRMPNGILDLYHHLVEDWSPVRSHYAFKEFCFLIRSMGLNPKWYQPKAILDSSSHRYDRYFQGQFTPLANQFIESFVVNKYSALWPYDQMYENPYVRFFKRILYRLSYRKAMFRDVHLVSSKSFEDKLYQFMNALFSNVTSAKQDTVVLNNAFEAYNPQRALNVFSRAKSIIVTRDPRDIYVSGQNYYNTTKADQKLQAVENDGVNKSFLAADDVEIFIDRFKLYMEHVHSESNEKILVFKYEDLLISYEDCVKKVLTFLGKEGKHQFPQKYFNPKNSMQNLGLWAKYSDQKTVAYIGEKLKEYTYAP